MHDGDPIFPKEVAKAMEGFMEAQADEDGITYDELRAVDRKSPIMLWPGIRHMFRVDLFCSVVVLVFMQ